jgi:hypothetical protein
MPLQIKFIRMANSWEMVNAWSLNMVILSLVIVVM